MGLVGHWNNLDSLQNQLAYQVPMTHAEVAHRDTIDGQIELLTNPLRYINDSNVPFAIFKLGLSLGCDEGAEKEVFIQPELYVSVAS